MHLQVNDCLSVLLVFFVIGECNAQRVIEELDTAYYSQYPFIRFVPSDTQDSTLFQLDDDDFLDNCGRIVFRVNKYNAYTNDSLIRLLDEEVIPRINRDSLSLIRMVLRGAASPEGPWLNNKMLGERRTQVLADFFCDRLAFPTGECAFEAVSFPEDYPLLCSMMRRANDADYPLVQKLCDRYMPTKNYAALKRQLRRVQQGRLWRRLLREYFPDLRTARVILFFRKYTPEPLDTMSGDASLPKPEFPVPNLRPLEMDDMPPLVLTSFVRVRQPRREILSIKSNMLFDVAYMPGYNRWCPIPNVALEFYPLHGHFTVGASIDFPWWQHYYKHKFFQVRNYQVEGRYYLRSGDIRKNAPGEGAAFRGVFFSAYAHAALYGICFNANHGWEGEALGAGVGAGYMLPLNRKGHWRLEFSAQVGFLYSGYDPYQYENPVNPAYRDHLYYYKWTGKKADFRERQHRLTWIGPTRVGVTLSYDLLYRRQAKRGIGFRNHEYKIVKVIN